MPRGPPAALDGDAGFRGRLSIGRGGEPLAVRELDDPLCTDVVDALVKSRDYLDAARYPTITFRLDRLTPVSKTAAELVGWITLRGVLAGA